MGLTASYMIDFWGKNRATLYAAEESATVARYNREVVTLTTLVTVANTYFQVLAAQDELRVARRNLAAAERIMTLINQQFAGGTASQLDVSQQQALVATERAAIPPLEVTLRQNIAALALLVARAPSNFNVSGGALTLDRGAAGNAGHAFGIALPAAGHPPGRGAARLLQFQRGIGARGLLPADPVDRDHRRAERGAGALFGPGAWYYTLAAGLTQPLFDGYLLESQLKQAKGVQLQNLQAYRKAVLSAFADVEKALVALSQTERQERLQIEAVRQFAKSLRRFGNPVARRHRQFDHRAADPADAAHQREHAGAGAADQIAGRLQPVPGARRRLDARRQTGLGANPEQAPEVPQ